MRIAAGLAAAVTTAVTVALGSATTAHAATVTPGPGTRTTARSAASLSTGTTTPAQSLTALGHRALWRSTARKAFAKAELAISTHGTTPFVHASLARTAANLYGWKDSRTTSYLAKVLAAQHPDGGWGLEMPADAYGDGSVNPPDTTYTVTTTDHVGPLLVEGYRAGVIPRSVLDRARQSVLTTHRTTTPAGTCIAYSRSVHDLASPQTCVHNVNASAAWFLKANLDLGLTNDPATASLVSSVMAYDRERLLTPINRWPYLGETSSAPQDLDHNSLNVEARILTEGGLRSSALGRTTLSAAQAAPLTADYTDRLAWVRLGVFAPDRSWMWQPYGEWLLKHTPRTGPTPHVTTIRYAQVAVYASRNALVAQ